jgi:hypothetical protein
MKIDQFIVDISDHVRLSVISGFGLGPEAGLIIGNECRDIVLLDTVQELFTIIRHLKSGDYSDFPDFTRELKEASNG